MTLSEQLRPQDQHKGFQIPDALKRFPGLRRTPENAHAAAIGKFERDLRVKLKKAARAGHDVPTFRAGNIEMYLQHSNQGDILFVDTHGQEASHQVVVLSNTGAVMHYLEDKSDEGMPNWQKVDPTLETQRLNALALQIMSVKDRDTSTVYRGPTAQDRNIPVIAATRNTSA